MKGASLQEGNASLLCGILRLRIGMRYNKLILHIVEEYFPFKGIQYRCKEGCVFERKAAVLAEKHCIFRQCLMFRRGDGRGPCAASSRFLRCKYVSVPFLLNSLEWTSDDSFAYGWYSDAFIFIAWVEKIWVQCGLKLLMKSGSV